MSVMLPRVLEPEVMDTAEEARDYDAMDHSAVNRVFVADFLAVWDGRGPILDLGTGTAQIPIEFCRQSPTGESRRRGRGRPHARLSPAKTSAGPGFAVANQVATGRCQGDAVRGRQLSGRHVEQHRASHTRTREPCSPRSPASRHRGRRSSSAICCGPPDVATLNQLVETYAAGANDHQKKMFAESLHAALTVDEVRELVPAMGFDPAGVRQTTDRHWTWVNRDRGRVAARHRLPDAQRGD